MLDKLSFDIKDGWKFVPFSEDFTKKNIDAQEFAVQYQGQDMSNTYIKPQEINPETDISLDFDAKVSISSIDLANEVIANTILTFSYVETVYLDSLKVKYTEQVEAITEIKPEYIEVTAVYTDKSEKLLTAGQYTITSLNGSGQENAKVTYSEKGITKEAVFIVNNPYTITLISDGDENQIIKYKFGTGKVLPIPTRAGYKFDGWYENSDFSGNPISNISTTEKGNKTFYAKWKSLEPQIPIVTTFKYDTDNEMWTSATSSMGVKAEVSDGGTLTYSWDLYKYTLIAGEKGSVPGCRKILSDYKESTIPMEKINDIMFAPWNPMSWMQESSINPDIYGITSPGIAGYCTITNTLEGKSKSVTVWVGTEAYKEMYNDAPKGNPLS